MVVAGLSVVFIITVVTKMVNPSSVDKSSPADKLTGQYGDFSILLGSDDLIVYVGIGIKPPKVYLKAVTDAQRMTEDVTGKKVVGMCGGTPLADVVFYLEDPRK
jgi:hypothetical protein